MLPKRSHYAYATVGCHENKKINMLEAVRQVFENEFNAILDKFAIITSGINEAYKSNQEYISNPGVYIFWKDDEIIKVGRHLTNSRKRALQHIHDNTKNEKVEMNTLQTLENSQAGIIFINCKNANDLHWVAAIEIYLEMNLKPVIRSGRIG